MTTPRYARFRSTTACLLFTSTVWSQSVWVVDAGGLGHFRDFPPAVAAAQAGDTLIVRSGSYAAAAITKGLKIVGDPGAQLNGAIVIANIAANETVAWRGVNPYVIIMGLDIRDCAGLVHVEDVQSPGIRIARCQQASLRHVTSGSGTAVIDSELLATECTFASLLTLGAPQHGMVTDRSTVTLVHTDTRGGTLYSGTTPGSGIHMRGGALTVAGIAATTIAAGGAIIGPNNPAPAILTEGGTLRIDPSVTLLPFGGSPPISGTASVTTVSVPTLRAGLAGISLATTFRGQPGDSVFLLIAVPQTPAMDTPFGRLWVSPLAHVVLDRALVGSLGVHATSTALPALPPMTLLTLQTIYSRQGNLGLSTPAPVILY